ncbi:metal-dependent transcriptional regulator [Lacrimispora sp.]|uniref:metal-dependent transcriptional regulator n=1 Tax=Lacrimispora sp. TaxID=2719234 RepID=UPI0028ADBD42|nr:metal-dependent transcriptional regulator [Lacrimispora sp.]
MPLYASGEDYLEAILVLKKQTGEVRSVDLARYMGYSKPSISHAVAMLKKGGFLDIDKDGCLLLTDSGQEIAEKIYERHCFFKNQLVTAGIDPQTADKEACQMEHIISDETFQKIKKHLCQKNKEDSHHRA